MATFFISRHSGAQEWAVREGYEGAKVVTHAGDDFFDGLEPGDLVLGTLPVQLAEQVCSVGAEYHHLELSIPAELRGKELTAEMMTELGATLTRFHITRG